MAVVEKVMRMRMMTTFMIDLVGNIFVVDTQCLHVMRDFSSIDRHRLDCCTRSGISLSLTMPIDG
jgi:hypothetical protein